MSENKDQEKTEPATPKRIEEARRKGQVAKSMEVSSVLILLTSLGVFSFAGSWMFWSLSDFMRGILQNSGSMHLNDIDTITTTLALIFKKVFIILMPLMLSILIAGVLANVAQIGFMMTGEPLIPKLSKLNPISGMKKFISLSSLVELSKSLIKIIVIGGVAALVIRGELENIPNLLQLDVREILSFIGKVSFKICFYTCLVLIILAALDYFFQRWKHEEDLKMTKQEVRDESKQSEGDPKVKARIRTIQREMSRRRMMEAVPEATVIITNPTSLAIALKYDTKEMIAPKVIAKGAGYLAARIKEIAKENDIPIVEQKPLAQTLFKAAEIGESIPAELYRAVAEILAYVYRLKGMKSQAR